MGTIAEGKRANSWDEQVHAFDAEAICGDMAGRRSCRQGQALISTYQAAI